jgi:hypothetical protein
MIEVDPSSLATRAGPSRDNPSGRP